MKIIDISVPIQKNVPLWPGTPPVRLKKVSTVDRYGSSNETRLEMSLHTGTHLDAPLHFLANGGSIDRSALGAFVGPALVVEVPRAKIITAAELKRLNIPRRAKRLLFKTSNTKRWRAKGFKKDFVGLSADGAAWLARRGVVLVGVDYLSVAAWSDIVPVHRILLKKKIALLEGINLSKVRPGNYQLICLPLAIVGAEASPCRAVLVQVDK